VCNTPGVVDREIRWTKRSLEALQEASELYLTGVFEDAQVCAVHGKRVTTMARDIQLVMRLRGR